MNYKSTFASITTIVVLLLFGHATYGMKVQEEIKHPQANKQTHSQDILINKLVDDGFTRTDLIAIFNDPRVAFLEKVLTINLINKYVKADYSRFWASFSS